MRSSPSAERPSPTIRAIRSGLTTHPHPSPDPYTDPGSEYQGGLKGRNSKAWGSSFAKATAGHAGRPAAAAPGFSGTQYRRAANACVARHRTRAPVLHFRCSPRTAAFAKASAPEAAGALLSRPSRPPLPPTSPPGGIMPFPGNSGALSLSRRLDPARSQESKRQAPRQPAPPAHC